MDAKILAFKEVQQRSTKGTLFLGFILMFIPSSFIAERRILDMGTWQTSEGVIIPMDVKQAAGSDKVFITSTATRRGDGEYIDHMTLTPDGEVLATQLVQDYIDS